MFSPDIVCSDAFLEMPASSRDLYFQLGMKADDDGFVSPRGIMRSVGASEDDLKILVGKRFVLPFKSGVIVIKHWKINNLVRKDWYRPTLHQEEYEQLETKDNGSYTELVNDSLTVRQHRLGKVSIGNEIHVVQDSEKETKVKNTRDGGGFESFWIQYPNKKDKVSAFAVWGGLSQEKKSLAVQDVPVRANTEDWRKDGGKYVPLAKTYLKNERWNDPVAVPEIVQSYGKSKN